MRIQIGNYILFETCLNALNIKFKKEYQFAKHLGRKWRSDYYIEHNDKKIAIEIEGGVFSRGRHVRGKGFLNDMEKYNFYTLLNIYLLRFTPQQMSNPSIPLDMVNSILMNLDSCEYHLRIKNLFNKK